MDASVLCACGFPLDGRQMVCAKCGEAVALARQGILDADVAHAGQTAVIAVAQAEQALNRARVGLYRGLRLVHGDGGRISQAVRDEVRRWVRDGRAVAHSNEPRNRGTILVWLAPGARSSSR
jgi:hypothetical protein